MLTFNERLKHVTLKIDRAEEHIKSLEHQLNSFLTSLPYKVRTKHNSERKIIYYVESAEPTPDCLSLIAGDVIQNLISALDHLAYQIVCRDTGDNPPNPKRIYFPIAENLAKYESSKRKKMDGAQQRTFDALDALKPYKGGNENLWALHQLNNIEKHRLLLTVGSKASGVNVGHLLARQLVNSFPAQAVAALESMNIFLKPADTGFPLSAGFELYMGDVDEIPDPEQQFQFDVALSEPGVIDGEPILDTINDFKKTVSEIISTLTPLLNDA